MRASDTDHDGTAELTVFQTGGDGQVYRRSVRLDDRAATPSKDPDNNLYDETHRPRRFKSGWDDLGDCTGASGRARTRDLPYS